MRGFEPVFSIRERMPWLVWAMMGFLGLSGMAFGHDDPSMEDLVEQQKEQVNLVLFGALVPVVLAFVFLVFVFYRAKREGQFKRRELELKSGRAEMELKALRAQVNPHFIFNCLNSIQLFMRNHDIETAENFLIKFSRLIRQILENSEHPELSLKDDLDTLRVYLDMEKARSDHSFNWEIRIAEKIDTENIFIPPLLFQPLVENSIWHGIDQTDKEARILLEIDKNGEYLECQISDTGRKSRAQQSHSGKTRKSFGMSLIRDRLQIYDNLYGTTSKVEMENDHRSNGMIVKIQIPIIEEE